MLGGGFRWRGVGEDEGMKGGGREGCGVGEGEGEAGRETFGEGFVYSVFFWWVWDWDWDWDTCLCLRGMVWMRVRYA